jgi:hypothetical protein
VTWERQDAQWQAANEALKTIGMLLEGNPTDWQAVTATALAGLLALELSKT